MRAYRKINKFDADQPFWPWVAAIANNHCIDLLRQSSRTKQLFGDENAETEGLAAADLPLLSGLINAESSQTLNDAIGELPDKYRVPLVLAYFNQSSYDAIAEQLSISRNHVGVLLLRAKQQLRAVLGDGPETDVAAEVTAFARTGN